MPDPKQQQPDQAAALDRPEELHDVALDQAAGGASRTEKKDRDLDSLGVER